MNLDVGTVTQPMEGTDTASVIRAAIATYPPDSGTRLLLSSDFNDTSGDTLAAAREAAAAGIPIDVLPIPYRVDNEVLVEALHAPTEAREEQTVGLRAVLRATQPSSGLLQLVHDGVPIDLNGDTAGTGIPITKKDWTVPPETDDEDESESSVDGRFIAVKQIDVPLAFAGPNKFEVVFEPDTGADSESTNNKAEAFTLVGGKGRVLFVDNIGGESGAILLKALMSHGVELDVISPEAFPTRMGQLQRYDAVIFQNVPAEMITGPQQKMLVKYVHDLGGGFVMVGGPDSFGAGAWTNTELDQYILPVSCKIPMQTMLPSGALVLVIDRSGSMAAPVMGSNKSQQELAGEAAILALSTLYPDDLVGVVAFDDSAKLIVDVQKNSDPARIAKLVRSIQPGGGTDIYSGLDLAYRKLAPFNMQDAAVRHVILLTDGQSQQGNYIKLVGQMVKSGISLSTIGVGDGHNAALLRQLANMGGGNYHPIQNPKHLPKVFIKEAKTIRKNLIKEEPFEPTLQTTGSPIMANVTAVPELKGFVLTGAKHDPRIFMPIVGPEGEPVFAHWQVGLGRAAAFTSDATNRWATDWLRWGGYADFWARTVRAIARPAQSRDADLVASIQGDRLVIRLDAAAADEQQSRRAVGSFGNFMNIRGGVVLPNGDVEQITLEQTGPGVYETTAPAAMTGNYIVDLHLYDQNGNVRRAVGGASRPPGEELRRFRSNMALAQQMAEITGGRVLDPNAADPAGLFERTRPFESRSVRPLWRTLLLWLVVLFLLDVACRRIAWDFGAIYGWLKGRLSAIAGSLQTRDIESEATLAALKQSRKRVEVEPVAAPPPSRTRKFEAAENAEPAADFADAVGAAKQETPRGPAVAVSPDGDTIEDESTTSRLLDAKRRAREKDV